MFDALLILNNPNTKIVNRCFLIYRPRSNIKHSKFLMNRSRMIEISSKKI